MTFQRSKPLRSDPDQVRAWQQRSRRRLPARSKRTIAENPVRRRVRRDALRAAGWRRGTPVAQVCQGRDRVPEVRCWHPEGVEPDVDEIVPRGVRPGGHLDPENVQVLCRAHHSWKHLHPLDAAARGLRRWSYE